MVELTQEQKNKIADTLNGTSGVYDNGIMEEYGIEDANSLEEIMEECEYGRCSDCGWWCEMSEFDEEDRCEDCQ